MDAKFCNSATRKTNYTKTKDALPLQASHKRENDWWALDDKRSPIFASIKVCGHTVTDWLEWLQGK